MTQEVNKQMVDVKNHPFFFYEIILALRIYSLNNSGGWEEIKEIEERRRILIDRKVLF